jgi:hypothetical protein
MCVRFVLTVHSESLYSMCNIDFMSDSDDIKEIGLRLVEDSKEEVFGSRRGVINELFPFIYDASKRMSSRAIGRWLETNSVKLSPSTIAKALREPEPYWQEMLDEIEPAALIYARAHKVDPMEILASYDLCRALKEQPPTLEYSENDQNSLANALDEYETAYATLEQDWFSLPESAIETCLANAEFGGKPTEENADAETKKEKNG